MSSAFIARRKSAARRDDAKYLIVNRFNLTKYRRQTIIATVSASQPAAGEPPRRKAKEPDAVFLMFFAAP
jgi:hypothetical protein